MKNKKWYWTRHGNDETKELSVYSSEKLSIRLIITRYFEPGKLIPVRVANFGIGVMKLERTRLQRLGFWFLRLRFKELTIKELKKLSARDQKKYLEERYYLYGIIPYLKNNFIEL